MPILRLKLFPRKSSVYRNDPNFGADGLGGIAQDFGYMPKNYAHGKSAGAPRLAVLYHERGSLQSANCDA
jgi:hypothetical protein